MADTDLPGWMPDYSSPGPGDYSSNSPSGGEGGRAPREYAPAAFQSQSLESATRWMKSHISSSFRGVTCIVMSSRGCRACGFLIFIAH